MYAVGCLYDDLWKIILHKRRCKERERNLKRKTSTGEENVLKETFWKEEFFEKNKDV